MTHFDYAAPLAVGKCKPDKERAAFLTGAYKTYVTERKRKRDEVSHRISQAKNKPLPLQQGYYFHIQLYGRSLFSFTCWVRAIRRLPNLSSAIYSGYFLFMNALVHLVHWTVPLFLFLARIPHGKDINHFIFTSFFKHSLRYLIGGNTQPVGVSSFLTVLLFGVTQIISVFLLNFLSRLLRRLFRHSLKFRQISSVYRAYSFPLPSLSDRRAPTGTSSISHLPRSKFANERLLLSVSF